MQIIALIIFGLALDGLQAELWKAQASEYSLT